MAKHFLLLPDKFFLWLQTQDMSSIDVRNGNIKQKIDITLKSGIKLFNRPVVNCHELQLDMISHPYFTAGDIKSICITNCISI